jgi:hypothetical protein
MLNDGAATQEMRRPLTGGQQDGRHPGELPIKGLQRFSFYSYSLYAMLCYELAGPVLYFFLLFKNLLKYFIPTGPAGRQKL